MSEYRYPPVGRCIYCGAQEVRLSDEHIIAFAIHGAMVLPEASCPACAKETARVEQICFRKLIGPFRTRMGFQTRRPKQRQKTLTIRTDTSTLEVPVSDFPRTLALPRMPVARALLGAPKFDSDSTDVVHTLWLWHHKGDLDEAATKYGSGGPIHVDFHFWMDMFLRMVAKVAHSYAVAELGYGKFKPFLTDLVLGKSNFSFHFIGGEEADHPATSDIHQLEISSQMIDGRNCVRVDVRLFSFVGAPTYHAIAGEL